MNIFKSWFEADKEHDSDYLNNPWAGLASYEDPATAERKLKFCGREDESYDVAKLIMGNIFVTLYGKSGIGKTSLLNAGVFPELREDFYTPISLRLGMRAEKCPLSFQTVIIDAVKRSIAHIESIDVIPAQDNQQSPDYLWKFFAGHRFYDKEGKPIVPVIVLDQFEEVFRFEREESETLLRQFDQCIVNGQSHRYEMNVRYVVSIREDDLYRLEDSIDNCYLPALKRCRYRLRSLSEQGAKDAISLPGYGLFINDEQEQIVQKIIQIARNKEDKSISTNLLSLVCNRLYVESRKTNSTLINLTLVDSFVKGNPFERFYNEATQGFSNKEKSYIEEHLVDSTGRRNSIPESDFLVNVKNGKILLDGKNRILQRTSTSSDGSNYRIELIHDSFCEPLSIQKQKREKRKRTIWLITLLSIVLSCLGVTLFILLQYNTILQQEKTITLKEDSLEKKNQLVEIKSQQLQSEQRNLERAQATILNKNNELEKNFLTLQNTRWNLRKNLIKLAVERGMQLIENGNSYLARLLAINILPKDINNPDLPHTVEAEALLRHSLICDDAIMQGGEYAYFNHDGTRIVSALGSTIRIWDAKTGKQIGKPLTGHNSFVSSVSFNHDGTKIVSGSWDNTIRIWDAKTGEKIGEPLIGHTKGRFHIGVLSVSFNHDGTEIVSAASDNTIIIWDAKTGKQIGEPLTGHTDHIKSVSFNHDGTKIVSGSEDNTIRIWDAKTGKQIGEPLTGHTKSVNSVSFNHDGTKIVSGSNDNTIRIWDVKTGEQIGEPLPGHTKSVNSVSFNHDGTKIVSGSNDNTIRIWDYSLNIICEISSVIEIGRYVKYTGFNHDRTKIVSISWDNTIRIWDAITRKQIGEPLRGHNQNINVVSFNHDGTKIVSGSDDNTIRIWDTKTGKQIGEPLRGHNRSVNAVSFNHNGTKIVSGSIDKTIRIWDTKTGKQIGEPLRGHNQSVYAVSFNHNGTKIVSAAYDNTIRIWNAKTGKQIGEPLLGHTEWIRSVSFNHDGTKIVSAAYDNTIRIWDISTGIMIDKIYIQGCNFVCWSPNNDEKLFCIMNKNEKDYIVIYEYPSLQKLIDMTRERFKDRPLTKEERARYNIDEIQNFDF